MTTLDRALHRAVTALDDDRLETLGWHLIKVGGCIAAGSVLTIGALHLGTRIGYYLFGDIL